MSLWRRHPGIAYGAVLLGVGGHASSEFVSVLTGIAGPELSVWRFLLGGLGLVLLALCFPESRNLAAPLRAHPLRLVLLSLVGVSGAYLAFHWALDFATVPQVATVVTTIPIFVAIINLRINGQPVSRGKVISGVAAVAGVAILITDGYLGQLAGTGRNLIGILLAMTCAALGAGYAVLVRPVIVEWGALRVTAVTMMLGGVGLWLVVAVFWGLPVNPATLFERAAGQWSALLVLALFNTTITQFLWFGGLAAVPDLTRGSYLFFLKPVIAATLAVGFLAQALSLAEVLAIGVICAAVAVEAGRDLVGRRP